WRVGRAGPARTAGHSRGGQERQGHPRTLRELRAPTGGEAGSGPEAVRDSAACALALAGAKWGRFPTSHGNEAGWKPAPRPKRLGAAQLADDAAQPKQGVQP